jgi:NAD(P)-dependent dehydrogenase (short-subunit alcohol dehydrogenase family)
LRAHHNPYPGAVECLAKELALFAPGVKVLIVEPGYFRTKVFSNIKHVEPRLPVYAQFNAGVRQYEASIIGNEPGDADKAVTRMIELVKGTGMAAGKQIPLRVPLGSDGWERIKAKCEETLAICGEWEDVAKSTDHVAVDAA